MAFQLKFIRMISVLAHRMSNFWPLTYPDVYLPNMLYAIPKCHTYSYTTPRCHTSKWALLTVRSASLLCWNMESLLLGNCKTLLCGMWQVFHHQPNYYRIVRYNLLFFILSFTGTVAMDTTQQKVKLSSVTPIILMRNHEENSQTHHLSS